MYIAKVRVYLKSNILDPQGKAVHHSMISMGYSNVEEVRVGKYVELKFEKGSREEIQRQTKEICEKILSNPIMESFDYQIEEIHPAGGKL
jgi:phosphoribosylformylglycinamidine synthase